MEAKAQISLEFMIIIGFFLFLFTAFFIAIQYNMEDEIFKNRNLAVKQTASFVQNEINLASKASEGYSRVFNIPVKINGMDYDINIVNEMVYLRAGNGKHSIALPVQAVQGDLVIGENRIKKEEGVVYVN